MKQTKVLIADKLESTRYILGDLLEYKGFQVFTADSEQVAIDIINKENPQINILELYVLDSPKYINGNRLLHEIKWRDKEAVCIMATFLSTDRFHILDAYEEGALCHISKPFEFSMILYFIDTANKILQEKESLQNAKTYQEVEYIRDNIAKLEFFLKGLIKDREQFERSIRRPF